MPSQLAAADHRHRLLARAGVAGAAQDRVYRGRISRAQLADMHDMAIKAAIKDQELAGIDIVSDGELRRDNDVDYLLARMPGLEIAATGKDFYFDYYDAADAAPLPEPRRRPARPRRRTSRSPAATPTGRCSSRSPARSPCPGGSPTTAYGDRARPGAGRRPGAQRRGARARRRRRPAAADRRAVPRRATPTRSALAVEAINIVTDGRGRDLGAARLLRQPLRPPAVGGPLRLPVPRGARRRRSTSSSWSSPARATRTSRSSTVGWDRVDRPRRGRRQVPRGRDPGPGRRSDPAGAGAGSRRSARDQPGLRAAPPARRRRPGEARRDGRRRPPLVRATRRPRRIPDDHPRKEQPHDPGRAARVSCSPPSR